jgi:hypothetical protein
VSVLLPSVSVSVLSPCMQRVAVLASVVSSRMLKAIAAAEGVEYYDTLTGRSERCHSSYLHLLIMLILLHFASASSLHCTHEASTH